MDILITHEASKEVGEKVEGRTICSEVRARFLNCLSSDFI